MKIYRLMCDRCDTPYPLYDGYRFFVELDVTLRCCRTPQRLEMSEHAYPAQWRTVQVGSTSLRSRWQICRRQSQDTPPNPLRIPL